jgi:hypothetical protein
VTDVNFAILIDFAAGGLTLAAVLIVWRRDLRAIVRLLAWQGVALAAIDRSSPTSGIALAPPCWCCGAVSWRRNGVRGAGVAPAVMVTVGGRTKPAELGVSLFGVLACAPGCCPTRVPRP